MPPLAFARTVPQAMRMVKSLGLQPTGWEEEDWHITAKVAITRVIEHQSDRGLYGEADRPPLRGDKAVGGEGLGVE